MRTVFAPSGRSDDPDQAPVPSVRARLPQPGREGLVAAAVTAGAVLVVGLWWVDTSPGSLHGLADQLTAAGRVTGLLGTYLVLIEVLLMGRVPWLDRLIGMDRLATWHRRNGQYSICLLAAHTLLTIWGYAGTDHAGFFHESGTILALPDVGPVQVRLTFQGHQIVDVTNLQLPNHAARSQQINNRAGPALRQEVLNAQSAQIDTVSGATTTSNAYAQCAQAILDQAWK